ncbi:MAG TPA: GNAT family N-acetyltransferase [Chitinophagales bacterium]
MEIQQIEDDNGTYFKAIENGETAGAMSYSWAGKEKFIIDHTEVNPAFNGKGVGKQLVLEAVKFARENNIKIMPLCPFARSVFDKNPDFADVRF